MTWTWHDDDPATAASAENLQTHVELRLRALEVAGSGGAGFVLGDEVLRTSDPDLAAGNEITPLDPTKAVLVNIKVTGGTDGSSVSINSWNGQSSVAGYAPQGFQISLALLLAPGETYYFSPGGAALERAIERTIG